MYARMVIGEANSEARRGGGSGGLATVGRLLCSERVQHVSVAVSFERRSHLSHGDDVNAYSEWKTLSHQRT